MVSSSFYDFTDKAVLGSNPKESTHLYLGGMENEIFSCKLC